MTCVIVLPTHFIVSVTVMLNCFSSSATVDMFHVANKKDNKLLRPDYWAALSVVLGKYLFV